MEPGSSHSGCDLALAYGGYLCSRQTGATGHKQSFHHWFLTAHYKLQSRNFQVCLKCLNVIAHPHY